MRRLPLGEWRTWPPLPPGNGDVFLLGNHPTGGIKSRMCNLTGISHRDEQQFAPQKICFFLGLKACCHLPRLSLLLSSSHRPGRTAGIKTLLECVDGSAALMLTSTVYSARSRSPHAVTMHMWQARAWSHWSAPSFWKPKKNFSGYPLCRPFFHRLNKHRVKKHSGAAYRALCIICLVKHRSLNWHVPGFVLYQRRWQEYKAV